MLTGNDSKFKYFCSKIPDATVIRPYNFEILARAFIRDSLARYRDPHLQRPTFYIQKSVCQNLVMGQSYGSCRIFLPAFICLDFPNMAIS